MKKLFREDEKIAYYASDDGKVFSFRKKSGTWRELKPRKTPDGYIQFASCLNGKVKNIYVHRAVYQAFCGDIPEGKEINHINCKRDDNRLSNLEVVTPSQNSNHPPTRGHKREAQTKRWSDPAQREKAREKAREAMRYKMRPVSDLSTGVVYESTMEAARQLGLNSGSISACCRGRVSHTGGHAFAYVPTEEECVEHEIRDHIENLANELSGGRL